MAKKSRNAPDTPETAIDQADLPPDFDPDVPTREAILQHLRNSGKPMSPKTLARALGTSADSVGYERRLKAMERDGQVFFNPKGQVLLNTQLDFIAGKVQGHRDGSGFAADDGGPDCSCAA